MAIDQKVAVRSVFVLTDAAFDDRCVLHSRQSQSKQASHFCQSLCGRNSIAVVSIERRAMSIDRDLDAASIDVGQAVSFRFEIDPGWHRRRSKSIVANGTFKIENFLTRWMNAPRQQIGKHLRQPWPAGEDISRS